MTGRGRNHKVYRGDGRKFGKRFEQQENKSNTEEIENSPVLKAFLGYRNELDQKHDKLERLIKMSRDITIESKRIIFLLHSNARGPNPISVLAEAKDRIFKLIDTVFFMIAKELEDEDPYQFNRAYYAGVQEFIEAYTFYHYLDSGKLYKWEDLNRDIIFKQSIKFAEEDDNSNLNDGKLGKLTEPELNSDNNEDHQKELDKSVDMSDESRAKEVSEKDLKVLLIPLDYVLGVQDLTGELMRHCISSLSFGQVDTMYQTCNFVRSIYSGLASFSKIPSKEFYRKLNVLRQSLIKIENACYMVRIRGSEIPKHMLADVVTCQDNTPIDEDEGFY